MQTMWTFRVGRFIVRAEIEPDDDLDLSWDETGETAENLASGAWEAFRTRVSVWAAGVELGHDWLCGSIYADPRDFFSEHRLAAKENERLRAEGSAARVGSYFPGMVREAVKEARATLASLQRVAA